MNIKKIIYIVICVVLFLTFNILMITAAVNINTAVSSKSVRSIPSVVIDAGHGGEDGGAVSDDGVLEKDINLEISQKTSAMLYMLGFDVTETRTDDTALDNGEETIRLRKVSDMKNRLKIYDSSDENVVISIHQNKFTQSKYHGTQIFYSPNNPNGKKLAENIKFSVKGLLQPDNERECKQADNGIYLLKNTHNPAVIVECGFISNKEEYEKLIDSEYQKQMAFSISAGFLNYCNTN